MTGFAIIWIVGQLTVLVMLVNWVREWFTGRPRSIEVENTCVAALLVLLVAFIILINTEGVDA